MIPRKFSCLTVVRIVVVSFINTDSVTDCFHYVICGPSTKERVPIIVHVEPMIPRINPVFRRPQTLQVTNQRIQKAIRLKGKLPQTSEIAWRCSWHRLVGKLAAGSHVAPYLKSIDIVLYTYLIDLTLTRSKCLPNSFIFRLHVMVENITHLRASYGLTVESTASTATRKMRKWYQRRLSLVVELDFSNHRRSLRTQFDPHRISSARPLRNETKRHCSLLLSSSRNSSRRPSLTCQNLSTTQLPNRTTASPSVQNAITNLAATHSTYIFNFLVLPTIPLHTVIINPSWFLHTCHLNTW